MKRTALILFSAALLTMAGCSQSPQSANRENTGKDFLQLASDRYSVRSFDSTAVDQKLIDKIIEAGQLAPTAVNSQPQKIYVVKSAEGMEKLRRVSPCMYGAPHCFIACYDDRNVCKRGEYGNYGDIDVSIVLTHMTLEAANLGIGTCLVGYFDPVELHKEFSLPANIHPVLLLPFGYPSEDSVPSEKHTTFRDLEEVIEYR